MSNSIKTIGDWAFAGCENLMKANISDSVKVIPSDCFEGCPLLKFNFPSHLEEIGDYAFFNLGLNKIILPNTVTKIGESALRVCAADTIILSDKVMELKRNTFEGCENLKYIYLGNSMKRIEGLCFNKCRSLQSLKLPSSMEYIEILNYDILNDCPNLKTIYCNSDRPYDAYFSTSVLSQATLYVPKGCKKIFMEDYRWNGFKEIIEMDGLGAVQEINGNECTTSICQEVYDLNGRFIANSTEGVTPGIYVVKKGTVREKVFVK